jgi:hypothetical protein
MITVIVRFKVPKDLTLEQARQGAEASAPSFRNLPGLVRKYYINDMNGTGGGVYLWESRAQAEAFYNEAFRQRIRDRFGCDPEISYFETPVVIDETLGEVQVAAE